MTMDMFDDDVVLLPGGHSPSPQQRAIFAEIARGRENLLVRARAGTAKTSTAVAALAYVPRGEKVAFFSFSRSTVAELASRVPPGIDVRTLHGHGNRALRWKLGTEFEVDEDKTLKLAREAFGDEQRGHPIRGYYYGVQRLIRVAKDTLAPATREALDELVDRFAIDAPPDEVLHPARCRYCREMVETNGRGRACPAPTAGGGAHEFPRLVECVLHPDGSVDETRTPRAVYLGAAVRLLELSEVRTELVDYADMCWLPVRLGHVPKRYQRVFVDEAQDLSPCQIALLKMSLLRGARICIIGDDRQALYSFRGADEQTVENLKREFRARELPLSVTYRCARSIVALARKEVPDYEAAPGSPEGDVLHVTPDRLVEEVAPGDFVISRSNAPLLGLCLRLLRERKPAVIKGADVLGDLRRFLQKFEITDAGELGRAVDQWFLKEIARLEDKYPENSRDLERVVDVVRDKYEAAKAVLDGGSTLDAALARFESVFVRDDAVENGRVDPRHVIVLGTTHKLKGLEADRVWMLENTYRREKNLEEKNCWYVAATRARHTLFLTRPLKDKEPEA